MKHDIAKITTKYHKNGGRRETFDNKNENKKQTHNCLKIVLTVVGQKKETPSGILPKRELQGVWWQGKKIPIKKTKKLILKNKAIRNKTEERVRWSRASKTVISP